MKQKMNVNEQWFLKGLNGNPSELAKSLSVSKLLAGLLLLRSVSDEAEARWFLEPDSSKMYNPFLMKDMDKAVEIICDAAAKGFRVMIVGDYDVDGITGIYILESVLSKVFPFVTHHVPHRMEDGYGINDKIIEIADEAGIGLIITCDNGISAWEQAEAAKKLGILMVVTDHHEVPFEIDETGGKRYRIPDADAVVDPKQEDCKYPFKKLCGAAVAYKLVLALCEKMDIRLTQEESNTLISMAAIATICDIVDLVDENREIVAQGLDLLNGVVHNQGIRALLYVCGGANKKLKAFDIGHVIGPCINAAGRLGTAELAVGLLFEKDPDEAARKAESILELNRKRQDITKDGFEQALLKIAEEQTDRNKVMLIYLPDVHESVLGIIAGKIKDRFAKPTIVLADAQDGFVKGSGRSVDGYNLLEAITAVQQLLVKFGGHALAIGITIEREKLAQFAEELNATCALEEKDQVPVVRIDMSIESSVLGFSLLDDLSRLEPFGRGNEKPLFAMKKARLVYAMLVGSKKSVVKMKLEAGTTKDIDAVFFGDTEVFLQVLGLQPNERYILVDASSPMNVDILFYPELNDYFGGKKLQLVVRNIRKSQG